MSNFPTDESILNSVVTSLELAILIRPPGSMIHDFRLIGSTPDWFKDVFVSADSLGESSPFLEDFIQGPALSVWNEEGNSLESGFWEEDRNSQSYFFQATALRCKAQEVLLISLANDAHNREQNYLQYAHEAQLTQKKLTKERERKEVLLNCIIHNLSSPLSTILMNIQFTKRQLDREDIRKALERAESQAELQRELIHSITHTYRSDLSHFEPAAFTENQTVEAISLVREFIESLHSSSQKTQINPILFLEPNIGPEIHVQAEHTHLLGIMNNMLDLITQASSRSPSLRFKIETIGERLRISILDEASQISDSHRRIITSALDSNTLTDISKDLANDSAFRLYFCKMTLEHWGGNIGYHNDANGTNSLWFELRKINNPSPLKTE